MHLQYCSYPRDPCNCGQLTREAAQQALEDAPRKRERIKKLETLLREAPKLFEWPEEEMEDEEGVEYKVHLVHGDWWNQLTAWYAKKDKLLEGKDANTE